LFQLKKRAKGKELGEGMTRTGSTPGVFGPYRISLSLGVRRACGSAAAAVLLVAFSMPCLLAKENKPTRVVTGVVSDEAENPIVGAAVVLTDLQTGKKNATYTREGGAYQFSDLQPTRDYEVQATHQGLASRVRKVSQFDPRNRIVLNLRIPPPKEE
jgi:hypothetical protein